MFARKISLSDPPVRRSHAGESGAWPASRRITSLLGLIVAGGVILSSCESRSVIAEWQCPSKTSSRLGMAGTAGAGGTSAGDTVSGSGFDTGFENLFCDYEDDGGRCVVTGNGSKQIVTEPVHSGNYAVAYTVGSDGNDGGQARCFRLGTLPTDATYGAWYYIPELTPVPTNGLWNLIHFQGGSGESGEPMPGLWDVTLVNKDDGSLRLTVFDFDLPNAIPDLSRAPSVPIGEWFHIEIHLKRAADGTGEFALYQNGTAILELTDATTEHEDTKEVQWYVGNLVGSKGPEKSTVYVDDVTITPTP
ncbi:MAG: hypothetical protein QM784_28250 [Polyangiaceae bacterium]